MSKNVSSRLIALSLCFLMLIPGNVFAGQASNDYTGHWAEKQIKSFMEKGIASPYKDGTFKPNNAITRAEFAAMANKAFGFIEKDKTNFKDVKAKDLYYDDMAIAKKAGYLTGISDGTVKPNSSMSRQEYAVIIARLLKLDTKLYMEEANKFKDADKIPSWSKGAVGAAAKYGYLNGLPGNIFDPTGSVTRGQAVVVLDRCYLDNVKISYEKSGNYSAKIVDGSVAINVADVTLEDTTINGNLVIGEGVGNGNVRLKNVIVKGKTIVRGGGANSITIEDSQITSIIIIKEDGKVRIVAVGRTSVGQVDMQSGGSLEEQGTGDNGFGYVTIAETVDPNEPIILRGNFESVQILADGVNLNVESGSVGSMYAAPTATNTRISLSAGTSVNLMSVEAPIQVTGTGTINTAEVKVQGTVITVPITTIKATVGITVATTLSTPAPAPAPVPPAPDDNSDDDSDSGPTIDIIEIQSRASGGGMPTSEVKVKVNGSFVNTYTLYFDGNPLASTTNGSVIVAKEVLRDLTRVKIQHNSILKSDTDGTVTNVTNW